MNVGDLLTFGCAIGFAFHCLALGHASPRIRYQPLALLQIGFCAVFMAMMPLVERPHMHLTPRLGCAGGGGGAGHGDGVLHSELGAVDFTGDAYGAVHDDGAGICLDYFVFGHGGAAGGEAGFGGGADSGGDCADGADSAASCAHCA